MAPENPALTYFQNQVVPLPQLLEHYGEWLDRYRWPLGQPSPSDGILPLSLHLKVSDGGCLVPVFPIRMSLKKGRPIVHSGPCGSVVNHTSGLQPKKGRLAVEHTYTPCWEPIADDLIDALVLRNGSTVMAVREFFRTTKVGVLLFTSANT